MNIFQFKSRIWVHHSFTIDQATTLSFKLVPNGLISLKYSQFTDALAAVKKHYEENKTWSYKLSNQLTLLSAKKLKASSMREKNRKQTWSTILMDPGNKINIPHFIWTDYWWEILNQNWNWNRGSQYSKMGC